MWGARDSSPSSNEGTGGKGPFFFRVCFILIWSARAVAGEAVAGPHNLPRGPGVRGAAGLRASCRLSRCVGRSSELSDDFEKETGSDGSLG